jgi:hypothetical protein
MSGQPHRPRVRGAGRPSGRRRRRPSRRREASSNSRVRSRSCGVLVVLPRADGHRHHRVHDRAVAALVRYFLPELDLLVAVVVAVVANHPDYVGSVVRIWRAHGGNSFQWAGTFAAPADMEKAPMRGLGSTVVLFSFERGPELG